MRDEAKGPSLMESALICAGPKKRLQEPLPATFQASGKASVD
jgi:hypothetical protein